MEDIKQLAAQLIKETRKAKGLTQKELGEILGLDKTTINKYESGTHNLTLETLSKLMDAMGEKLLIKKG